MSLFIDLVETFDLRTLSSYTYSKKIEGLINRFPRFKKDCRYHTVLPQKLAQTADDYMSIKLCTAGRVPVYGIYNRNDVHLVGVCVGGTVFALHHPCNDLHPSFVPDLKFRKVDFGIQNTPFAVTETVSYTKESICSAISTFSLGYTPEKKNEWCNAIVLLVGITSQAVRFYEMKCSVKIGLQTTVYDDRGIYPDSRILGLINRWNKISKAIRRGEGPYFFTYYKTNRRFCPAMVCEQSSGKLTLSVISDKGRTKRDTLRRTNAKCDEKRVRKRIKWKRMEKKNLKHVIRILRMEPSRNIWKEKTKNKRLWESLNNSHGYWYGSVDALDFEVASVKCLLRPNSAFIDNRYLLSASSPLDRLKAVLQLKITRASVLVVVKNIWNGSGLLSFSRGKSLIFESWGFDSDASRSFPPFRWPYPLYRDPLLAALQASYRAIAYCTCPVFTAAEFYLCAKRHKIKVDKLNLIEHCGTSKSEFDRIPTSMKDLCFGQFRNFKEKKDTSKVKWNRVETSPRVQVGCGRFSGALGATCVYPLLALRTRTKAQHLNANAACIGMFDVFRGILQHQREGLRGFYVTALKTWTKCLLMKK